MRFNSSTSSKSAWTLLKYTVLSLVLLVSACSRKPNLIPYGFGEVFKDPARASTAARVDYPLLYTMDPTATYITFRVTEYGERSWFWEKEFWYRPLWDAIKWYQIALLKQALGPAICSPDPTPPDTKTDVTEIQCKFAKGTAGDYFDTPLTVLLNYYADGQEKAPGDEDTPTGTVSRVLYVIPKK